MKTVGPYITVRKIVVKRYELEELVVYWKILNRDKLGFPLGLNLFNDLNKFQ